MISDTYRLRSVAQAFSNSKVQLEGSEYFDMRVRGSASCVTLKRCIKYGCYTFDLVRAHYKIALKSISCGSAYCFHWWDILRHMKHRSKTKLLRAGSARGKIHGLKSCNREEFSRTGLSPRL